VSKRRMLVVSMAALLLATASCADFTLYGVMQGEIPGGALRISPVGATVVVGETCGFLASGGTPPYSFTVFSGSGSIDADSGLYTAPSSPANEIIQVQDSRGATSQATATVIY
jgi:hypothetical protein